MSEKEMVRVNTRISKTLNDWLDEESAKTGLSKSSLIMMAAENYRKEKEVMASMADMGHLMTTLERLQQSVERMERNAGTDRA